MIVCNPPHRHVAKPRFRSARTDRRSPSTSRQQTQAAGFVMFHGNTAETERNKSVYCWCLRGISSRLLAFFLVPTNDKTKKIRACLELHARCRTLDNDHHLQKVSFALHLMYSFIFLLNRKKKTAKATQRHLIRVSNICELSRKLGWGARLHLKPNPGPCSVTSTHRRSLVQQTETLHNRSLAISSDSTFVL